MSPNAFVEALVTVMGDLKAGVRRYRVATGLVPSGLPREPQYASEGGTRQGWQTRHIAAVTWRVTTYVF